MATDRAPVIPPFLKIALTTARPLLARSLVTVPAADLARELRDFIVTLSPEEQAGFQRLVEALHGG